VNNKDDCLKLNHVVYLINRVMMHGTTNIKLKEKILIGKRIILNWILK
jgi:hypothetical protein